MKKLPLILLLVFLTNCFQLFSQKAVSKTISEGEIIVYKDSSKQDIDSIIISRKNFAEMKMMLIDSVYSKGFFIKNVEELDAINSTLSKKQDKPKNFFIPFNLEKTLLLFTSLLLIGFIIYTLVEKKRLRDHILFTVTGMRSGDSNISRINKWRNDIVNEATEKANLNQNELASIKTNISDLKRNVDDMVRRLSNLENNSKLESNSIQPKSERSRQVDEPKILYADAIVNDQFNRVTELPNEDTVYEINLLSVTDKNGSFTVYKDAYRRVLINPDFVDGCEKQKLSMSPTNLEVVEGKTQLNEYGKWMIVQKANVKFI